MLHEYRRKRDPGRTPEPFGVRRGPSSRLFVIQKHAARRLHYDLRLEIDGTLKSWAVPKGPSVRAEEKRLAVHVEDHPVEYADFEGVIPPGNYGAGEVIVWDRGWYRPLKEGDLAAQLARGRLDVELFGVKLRGAWTLARMSDKGAARGDGPGTNWLLLKKTDAFAAHEEITERWPESILSGLTVEELRASPRRRAELRARLARLGVPAGEVRPAGDALMLTESRARPFSSPDWLFEIKYDGVRVLAWRAGDAVELYGRKGQPFTARYPEIVRALRALPLPRFVLDGEIVALEENGRPSFQRLQLRMHLTHPIEIERARATVPVTGVFFDALALDGRDLRALPLGERKAYLALVVPARGVVRYGDHVVEHGEAFYAACAEQRLEGIVAKRVASRYAAGRSRDWLKIKCEKRQEFVIGGFTDPRGSRGHFGALHVGLYEDGRLVYVSKVGTGFDDAMLTRLMERLRPLARATSPFDVGTPGGRGHHWVEPRLVCEVRFTEWTSQGGLRHPTFLGLRDDKAPEECRRETPPADASADALLPPVEPQAAPVAEPPRVTISNPRKVFWPDEGYTKADLVAYYEAVSAWLLPYLADRPIVLTRYPDGITGKSFYQKDAPDFVPSWVRTERVWASDVAAGGEVVRRPSGRFRGSGGREIDYFVVGDLETLRYVVNLGAIPLHLWGSRVGSLERPDWLILDLDPKGAPFTDVVKVARTLHRLLDALELPSYVKTSGATGLHILVPLGARYTYEETRTFARLLATLGVEAEPDISTIVRPVRDRGGKVYIDYLQNGHGQTIVAPFSVRPLAGAPVSCPLRWDEVTARLDPRRFTIATMPARLAKVGDPVAPVLRGAIDIAGALARIEGKLRRQ
jgi:bifunctional non-homologous end joining protein LigD